MSMNFCKTCKFWVVPDERSWRAREICQPLDPDTYEPMRTEFEVRECASDKIVRFERPVINNGVSLIDGSDYMAKMMTAENFGCVNHEAG